MLLSVRNTINNRRMILTLISLSCFLRDVALIGNKLHVWKPLYWIYLSVCSRSGVVVLLVLVVLRIRKLGA